MEAASTTAIPSTSSYATFWRRFAAILIDSSIIHLLMLPFIFWYLKSSHLWDMILMANKARQAGLFSGDNSMILGSIFGSLINTICILLGARTVFDILYHGIWESSKFQATPGKLATHLKVVDQNGNRLSILQSCLRNLFKILSNITFFIGYLMALVTDRHQALHDKLAKCYVLKTSYEIPHMNGVEYAGFWRRLMAFVMDTILLAVLFSPLKIFLLSDTKTLQEIFLHNIQVPNDIWFPSVDEVIHESWLGIITTFITFFYFASFESSRLQATPGKLAIGIRVTDTLGQRLSFWMAAGRHVSKYVSQITLGIGYIMAGFTPKAQALHDELADTLVIKSQVPVE
jgi:uncharacterized RDD family membrane protein YckC